MAQRPTDPSPTTGLPDGLPLLSAGAHRDGSGACLMEYTSVLAGQPFTDRPACTHPVLAHLARRVNDLVDDAHRNRLAVLAADLAGLGRQDPRIGPAVLATTAEATLRAIPGDPRVARLRRRNLRRLARLESSTARRRLARTNPLANQAAVALLHEVFDTDLARLSRAERNRRLPELLADTVAACRTLQAGPDGGAPAPRLPSPNAARVAAG